MKNFGARFSLYPMSDRFIPIILGALEKTNTTGLYSNTDGEIIVRVKIENEFGTFYGEEITLNKGANGGQSGESGGKRGCKGGIAAGALPFVIASAAIIAKKRRKI